MDDILDYSRFDIESYQMLVDSRRRDAATYSSSGDYAIDLSENPFKQVVGIELLRASIPRTGYVIDTGYNTFQYALGWPPYASAAFKEVTITPGDYNLPQLCDELNRQFGISASPGEPVIKASPLSNPAEITNRIAFDAPVPFCLVLERLAFGGKVGFGAPASASQVAAGAYDTTPAFKQSGFKEANVFVAVQTVGTGEIAAFLGPVPVLEALELQAGATYDQAFTAKQGGIPSSFAVSVASLSGPGTLSVEVVVADSTVVARGAADILKEGQVTVPLSYATGSGGLAVDTVAKIRLRVTQPCALHVESTNLPYDTSNTIYKDSVVLTREKTFCATLSVRTEGFRIMSPGVVDLTGDRFLVVRCPEIESHMYRGERLASESQHPGIGLLSMGTYGFSEAKMDYFHSKPRTLTVPIARLSKLSIRLESQNGRLYPTRGCDHTLLLNVRYLVPRADRGELAKMPSILSPGYHPDQWQYARDHTFRDRPGLFRTLTRH